jgi:hypothetical protein
MMLNLWTVGACAAAGKLPPPGWTVPDENAKSISVSDVSRFGESLLSSCPNTTRS